MKITAPKIRKMLIGLTMEEARDMIENKLGLTVELREHNEYHAMYHIVNGPTKMTYLFIVSSRIFGQVVRVHVGY